MAINVLDLSDSFDAVPDFGCSYKSRVNSALELNTKLGKKAQHSVDELSSNVFGVNKQWLRPHLHHRCK